MIVNEYLNYHKEYAKKYGKKTIVFMEIGSFFEAYTTDDCGPDLHNVSQILNVVLTKWERESLGF